MIRILYVGTEKKIMQYNFKFATSRQIDNSISPELLDSCFEKLVTIFTLEWLNQSDGNKIQNLWQRKDLLATTELFSLGFAILSLQDYKDFINDKVIQIKSSDIKNVNGALFEIFGLSFLTKHYRTIPSKKNQSGFDGEIHFSKNKQARLSIKNFSISTHHQSFLNESKKIEDLIQKNIKEYNCNPLEILIHKKNSYPSDSDWEVLRDNIEGCFPYYNESPNKSLFRCEIGDWSVTIKSLENPNKLFAQSQKSYTLILSSNFHKNEEKNMFDKLEEACGNLAKHGGDETSEIKNFIIIHLQSNVSRENCKLWVENYFKERPNKPISAVILYQPLVVKSNSSEEYISHGISIRHF